MSGVDDRDDDLAIPELRSTARGELRPIAWRKHPKTENPNRSGNKELRDMHFPYLPEANHTQKASVLIAVPHAPVPMGIGKGHVPHVRSSRIVHPTQSVVYKVKDVYARFC